MLALCTVGVLIISSLWTERFHIPPDPELWAKWVTQLEELRKARGDAAEFAEEEFKRERQKRTLERISLNSGLASKTAKLLKWSFRMLSLAVCLEFLCLLWLAFWHL